MGIDNMIEMERVKKKIRDFIKSLDIGDCKCKITVNMAGKSRKITFEETYDD